ncbi:MAG: replication-associated recombination protein A [Planctomycetota bacterium]|nr:replication-associated recombination protein A [Planctomycetota bacterium]
MAGHRAPLADRLRPESLDDVHGQAGVLAEGSLLRTAFEEGAVPSLVLWGPPGTGKTTLARLLSGKSGMAFEALSAVTSGVKDVREVIARAKLRQDDGTGTLLFVDEIHRFNRSQQDAFLPHIEDGTIVLVGATTENPGFSLIGALLSRVRVIQLEPLSEDALGAIIDRARSNRLHGLDGDTVVEDDARQALFAVAGGDGRKLLNILESAVHLAGGAPVTGDLVREAAQTPLTAYNASGDDRFDLLSAFHKSLRGSDVDAALFWMGRMLVGGEDALVICRRMVAMAAEDVGLADPRALTVALDAVRAVQFLGQPEGELAVAEAVIYLATAPKSNSAALALGAAKAAQAHSEDPVPLVIRNAPTRLARELGHGKGYEYPHDRPNSVSTQAYLPAGLEGLRLYDPKAVGDERETARRLAWWRKLRHPGKGE